MIQESRVMKKFREVVTLQQSKGQEQEDLPMWWVALRLEVMQKVLQLQAHQLSQRTKKRANKIMSKESHD